MKRITFTDRLDAFMESASEREVRDMITTVNVWVRLKRLPFRIQTVEGKSAPAKAKDSNTPEIEHALKLAFPDEPEKGLPR